jgi:hypothetical protein
MSDSARCDHCLHECFTDNPITRDPKKRPIPIDAFFAGCKIKINYGKGKNNPISFLVFVEGSTDKEFWKKIGKPNSIKVVSDLIPPDNDLSHDNKTNSPNNPRGKFVIRSNKKAIECLFCKENQHLLDLSIKEEFFLNNHAIGMVDMDFEHAEPSTDSEYDPDINIHYDPSQFYPLFRTETRDLEILLCKLGGLRHFFSNHVEMESHVSRDEIERKIDEIQNELLSLATISGYARFLNAKMKFFIKFDRLTKKVGGNPFCGFIHNKNLTSTDITTLLQMNENNIRGRPLLFFTPYKEQCPKRKQLIDGDLWSICQGHDTMQILECMFKCGRIKCKKYPNSSSISENDLTNIILEEFVNNKCYGQSEMIAQMIEWEKKYHPSYFETSSRGKLFIKRVYMEFNQKDS